MARIGRRPNVASELTELRVAVIELRERLAAEQQSTAALQFRLQELERRNHELAIRFTRDQAALASSGASGIPPLADPPVSRPADTPADPSFGLPPPIRSVSIDRLATVAASASHTAERNEHAIEELRSSLQRVHGRLDELAFGMQTRLTDLGFEIERAAASSRASAAVSDLALDRQLESLRSSQVKLATEQARYEINLRNELADIADGLRRYASAHGGRREIADPETD
jgi:CII-binding regulator of phage lambda lysogenization HflD